MQTMTDRMLNYEQVAEIVGCTSRHIQNLVRAGMMPAPIKIRRMTRWRESDISNWMHSGCPSCDSESK